MAFGDSSDDAAIRRRQEQRDQLLGGTPLGAPKAPAARSGVKKGGKPDKKKKKKPPKPPPPPTGSDAIPGYRDNINDAYERGAGGNPNLLPGQYVDPNHAYGSGAGDLSARAQQRTGLGQQMAENDPTALFRHHLGMAGLNPNFGSPMGDFLQEEFESNILPEYRRVRNLTNMNLTLDAFLRGIEGGMPPGMVTTPPPEAGPDQRRQRQGPPNQGPKPPPGGRVVVDRVRANPPPGQGPPPLGPAGQGRGPRDNRLMVNPVGPNRPLPQRPPPGPGQMLGMVPRRAANQQPMAGRPLEGASPIPRMGPPPPRAQGPLGSVGGPQGPQGPGGGAARNPFLLNNPLSGRRERQGEGQGGPLGAGFGGGLFGGGPTEGPLGKALPKPKPKKKKKVKPLGPATGSSGTEPSNPAYGTPGAEAAATWRRAFNEADPFRRRANNANMFGGGSTAWAAYK